jgi:hypothetical protein
VVTQPLGYAKAARIFTEMTIGGLRGRLKLP